MARSIVASLLAHAEARPDSFALLQGEHGVSYATLAREIEATAARLHAWGVRAGDTVALELDARYAGMLVRLFYALDYLGASVLMLFQGMPAAQREHLLDAAGIKRIEPAQFHAQAPRTAPAAPRGDDPERPFLYQFTSGSTRAPKALLLTNTHLAEQCAAGAAAIGSSADDRLLSAVPWPMAIGVRHMVRIHIVGGAFVNEELPLERRAFAALVERFGITQARVSPAQLRMLIASPVPAAAMPALKTLVVGGAHLTPEEIDAARRSITPNVYVVYGATEIGVISVQLPGDPVEAGGSLAEHIDAEAVDEQHRALPAGVAGRIRLRAPWMPRGYVIGESAESFREGWFYPGDRAVIGADRRLTLLGRDDDIINRSGVKIDPRGLEQALGAHPDVVEVAVVAAPHALAGQVPVAFVVLRRNVPTGQLLDYWREHIEAVSMPERVCVLPALERSADGKILRGKLREMAAQSAA